MRKILVLGANSAMARAAIRHFAKEGHAFFLVGRNPDKLDSLVSDLKSRGVRHVEFMTADLADLSRHSQILEKASKSMSGFDTALLAFGDLGNAKLAHHSVEAALPIFHTNLLSPVSLLTMIADDFEKRAKTAAPGTAYSIGVITSAAGDCGSQEDYIYGAAKGGLSTFLTGLSERLKTAKIEVINFKPCFHRSDLHTDHVKQGQKIAQSFGKGSGVYYLPWYGRFFGILKRLRRLRLPLKP